jgi:hypothetical protein
VKAAVILWVTAHARQPKVNGVEIHYAIGGAGEPVFLLLGVPKTMSYWRHVVPLQTTP